MTLGKYDNSGLLTCIEDKEGYTSLNNEGGNISMIIKTNKFHNISGMELL